MKISAYPEQLFTHFGSFFCGKCFPLPTKLGKKCSLQKLAYRISAAVGSVKNIIDIRHIFIFYRTEKLQFPVILRRRPSPAVQRKNRDIAFCAFAVCLIAAVAVKFRLGFDNVSIIYHVTCMEHLFHLAFGQCLFYLGYLLIT